MKSKVNIFVLMLVGILIMSCSRVDPGHVGVKVKTLGQNKGVSPVSLGVGRYWMGLYYDLYTYPTYTVIYPFTAGQDEGSPLPEQIVFQDVNGNACDVDVALSAHVDAEKAPIVFNTYLKEMIDVVKLYCRQDINNFFVEYASKFNVEQIYSTEKMNMLNFVKLKLKEKYDPTGIVIDDLAYKSNIRFPEVVTQAINAKIEATQIALKKEQEVMQAEAEAKKMIATARGQFVTDSLKAAGNLLLTASITPTLVNYELAKRWNGVSPIYSNGVLPSLLTTK